jgi:uncharacterized protein (UPF0332 family)
VTPETREHLDKAHEHLTKARTILDLLHYADEAGRLAYLAAFHAAQALISERTARVAKTHAGVHSQFNLLTKDDNRVDAELRRFLSDAFDLKSVADYEVGPDAVVSPEEAEAAIATATRFINRIAEILA